MRRAAIAAVICLLLAGCASTPTLDHVVDGDTLHVRVDGALERVRLWAVNTPERGKPGAREATAALRALCTGVDIKLDRVGRDRAGRTVARVWCGGQDAALVLLRAGHATVDARFHPPAEYR